MNGDDTSPAIGPGDTPVLLYDGDCGFCQNSLKFLLKHERRPRLRFAPLRSPAGQRLLRAAGLPADFSSSLVLVEPGQTATHSTAVLRLAGYLRWPWQIARVGWLVPRVLRDAAYRFIARHRHMLPAGRACATPRPGDRERFLG